MKLPEDNWRILAVAFLFAVSGMALDAGTTQICPYLMTGCYELNPLLRGPFGQFLLFKWSMLAPVFLLFRYLLPVLFLYAAFRKYWIASLPLWYAGWHAFGVVAGNILVLLSGTLF
mgnify:CR=1 FL=1